MYAVLSAESYLHVIKKNTSGIWCLYLADLDDQQEALRLVDLLNAAEKGEK